MFSFVQHSFFPILLCEGCCASSNGNALQKHFYDIDLELHQLYSKSDTNTTPAQITNIYKLYYERHSSEVTEAASKGQCFAPFIANYSSSSCTSHSYSSYFVTFVDHSYADTVKYFLDHVKYFNPQHTYMLQVRNQMATFSDSVIRAMNQVRNTKSVLSPQQLELESTSGLYSSQVQALSHLIQWEELFNTKMYTSEALQTLVYLLRWCKAHNSNNGESKFYPQGEDLQLLVQGKDSQRIELRMAQIRKRYNVKSITPSNENALEVTFEDEGIEQLSKVPLYEFAAHFAVLNLTDYVTTLEELEDYREDIDRLCSVAFTYLEYAIREQQYWSVYVLLRELELTHVPHELVKKFAFAVRKNSSETPEQKHQQFMYNLHVYANMTIGIRERAFKQFLFEQCKGPDMSYRNITIETSL